MILGRGDFIPVDLWALKLVSHEWYDGAPVKPAQVEAHFEEWGEFKGLAYWFWDWKYQGQRMLRPVGLHQYWIIGCTAVVWATQTWLK